MKYKIVNINKYDKDKIINFYQDLQQIKKEKISKYKRKSRKLSSIIGELSLSELLEENYKINYQDLTFFTNENGKPYLKNINLFFNISHSFDYVITIISNKEIGIDIEKIRKIPIKTINLFATPKEKAYILSSKENIEKRIFEIYTLKEAYFKMKGTNLKEILNIEFTIKDNNISCNSPNINIGFINNIDDYIIAYCEKK